MKFEQNLIQTKICSIIYSEQHGEVKEMFRCPRNLDQTDLRDYVNQDKCLLGFEPDDTDDLKTSNFLGYYRLHFISGKFYGKWFECDGQMDPSFYAGVDEIVRFLNNNFPRGCSFEMEEWLEQFPVWGCKQRYLLKPLLSNHFKVLFETTYGNSDYPVRIYVYE